MRTPEGKQISSLNAVRHGCCSEILMVPGEDRADYEELETSWYRAFGINPESLKDETEVGLISKLVLSDWLARRATRHYLQVQAKILAAQPDPAEWTEEHHKTLARFLRYRTANDNTFEKHRRTVEAFRKSRANDIVRCQTIREKEEKISLAQERLKTAQTKNAPEPTWAERLAAMRQQAIELGYHPPDGPNPALNR